jgi:hypothetical protein
MQPVSIGMFSLIRHGWQGIRFDQSALEEEWCFIPVFSKPVIC